MTTEVQAGGKFKNVLKITNPSPLEIDIPQSTFQYIDETGITIAEQYGNLPIVRGISYHDVTGEVRAKNPRGKLRLVGTDVAQTSWMKETIKFFQSEIVMTSELASLVS